MRSSKMFTPDSNNYNALISHQKKQKKARNYSRASLKSGQFNIISVCGIGR